MILSCSSDDENTSNTGDNPDLTTKLLKKVTVSNPNQTYSINFYYNSENLIDKLEYLDTGSGFIEQYFYVNDELTKIERQDLNGIFQGRKEEYTYENGLPTERRDFINTSTLDEVFKYSYTSNLLSNIQYFGFNETEFSEQDIFQYNSNQNVISITTDYVNNSIVDTRTDYTYDTKNSPFENVEPKITLIEGVVSFNNNPVTEEKIDLTTNNVIDSKDYSYTYDSEDYPLTQTDGNETLTFEYY